MVTPPSMIPSLEDKDRVALRALRTKPSSRSESTMAYKKLKFMPMKHGVKLMSN